jgi:phosphate/sulfate permease
MNENNITRTEAERKAVDAVFNIMLVFTALLLAFCLGYYIAAAEAAALVKTILTNQQ